MICLEILFYKLKMGTIGKHPEIGDGVELHVVVFDFYSILSNIY